MNQELKSNLMEILSQDVNNFKGYSLDTQEKAKGLKIIEQEIDILKNDEKHTLEKTSKRKELKIKELKEQAQQALDAKKFELEKEKVESQKIIDERKQNLEENKFEFTKNIDERKLILEQEKFKHQQEIDIRRESLEERKVIVEENKLDLDLDRFKEEIRKEELERQERRIHKVIDIGIEVTRIVLPLAVYANLVMRNFRLIYADDGRVPSEMKDLMKNVYKR